MAKRDDLNTSGPGRNDDTRSTTTSKEQRLVALAEQLGRIAGTIQGKAEGWLNSGSRPASAADTSPGGSSDKPARQTKASGTVASKVRAAAKTSGRVKTKGGSKGRSGGLVDAPRKKHRKPSPSESGATGAPRGEGSRIAKLKARNQNRLQRRG